MTRTAIRMSAGMIGTLALAPLWLAMPAALAAPVGTTVRGADAAKVGADAPAPADGSEENFTVHGQRHYVAPPTADQSVIDKFEGGGYRAKKGWLNTSRYQPGSGRDANTDAAIGQFGSAYGSSSPSPGANLSAPGTQSPIGSGGIQH